MNNFWLKLYIFSPVVQDQNYTESRLFSPCLNCVLHSSLPAVYLSSSPSTTAFL